VKTFFILASLCLTVLLGSCNFSIPAPTPEAVASEPIETQANFWQQLGNEVGSGSYPSISQTVNGYPVVAYTDNSVGPAGKVFVKKWNTLGWLQLGDALNNAALSPLDLPTKSSVSSLAVNGSGNPVVAYTDCVANFQVLPPQCTGQGIFVKRWDGTNWQQLGTLLDISNNKTAREPKIVLNSAGNPVVTWTEQVGTSTNIYVERWNGSSWVQLGATLDINISKEVYDPGLALDSAGNPVVTWSECVAVSSLRGSCLNYNVYAKRWNGNSWVQLGTSLDVNPNESAFQPTLVVDSSGNPIVTWNEFDITAATKVYVKRWNGSSWVQLGTSLNVGTLEANDSTIALDGAGNPLVNWSENTNRNTGTYNIYVKRWKDNTWSLFGPNPVNKAPITVGFEPSISVVNGNYAVAWTGRDGSDGQQNVYVHRYAINAWQPLSEALDNDLSLDAKFTSVARTSSDRPIVAWTEQISASDYNVYVKEWLGTAWKSLGTVDKVAGNFTTSASIAMRSDNRPVVAFTESSNSNSLIDVFVRRWTGAAWQDVGGALNYSDIDIAPSLALNSANTPYLAWLSCPAQCNLYVRKFDGTNWVALGGVSTPLAGGLYGGSNPTLLLDSLGNPVVGWIEASAIGYTLKLRRWTGTAWQALSSIYLGYYSNFSMALDSTNKVYVAMTKNNQLNVYYLDGTWKSLGGTLEFNNPEYPLLSIGSDNRPVIAWKLTLPLPLGWKGFTARRWDGSTWVNVGTSSITGSYENPLRPDMVLKSNNNPIVSFDMQLQSTTKQDVYVKQY
jgi:hypothetical protein